ncbi:WXG100 family type VII secretion target [Peterkaempfera bronchialis]|uniref:WXG100 family type VII secretion target n=1 Tax=Peterkaempfera bronchialis TaxID=2126346 RepID=UPI003C2CE7D1
MDEATTDFGQYSHGELKRMVDSLNSGDIMKAADPWRRTYDTLKGIRTALQSYSGQATTDWEGQASSAFYTRMTKLANSVNNTAEYANDTAVTLEIVADSIDEAKAAMPDEPSAWDRTTDWVDDKVSGLFGADDADTRQSEADSRKQQAVAIMQTLTRRYQASAAILNPPPATEGWDRSDDDPWPPAPPDPTGAGAIGGAIIGAGLGGIAGASAGGSTSGGSGKSHSSGAPGSLAVAATATGASAVIDPGIHGGAAATASLGPSSSGATSGTGIDATGGITGGTRAPSPTAGLTGGDRPSPQGVGGGAPSGANGLPGGGRVPGGLAPSEGRGSGSLGGGLNRGTGAGRTRSGANVVGEAPLGEGTGRSVGGFGSAGAVGGGVGSGARPGAAAGGGLARRSGGVVGESVADSRGGTFTEGGTGIGSRSRSGQAGGSTQATGGLAGSRGRRRDEERRGERPDYLVEDEETWVDGTRPNPDVVE